MFLPITFFLKCGDQSDLHGEFNLYAPELYALFPSLPTPIYIPSFFCFAGFQGL